MKPAAFLVPFLCTYIAVHLIGYACAQRVPLCLHHRTDVVPCNYRHPQRTKTPSKNEWGEYITRVKPGPKCDILNKRHKVRKIGTIGEDPRVKLIFSPRINNDSPWKYPSQTIAFYEIACPPNHGFSFFNITRIDMEPPNCLDPNSRTLKCSDYVQVKQVGGGTRESCGKDPGKNREELIAGDFQMVFRSDDKRNFFGFRSVLICVSNTQIDGVSDNDNRRKRNSQETFDQDIEDQIERVKRTREYYDNLDLLSDVEQWFPYLVRINSLSILSGQSVTYASKMLTTMQGSDSQTFGEVQSLQVINADGNCRVFETITSEKVEGPGSLTVAGSTAFFREYPDIVSSLTEEQRAVLFELSKAYYEQLVVPPETSQCDEPLDPDNLPSDDLDYDNAPTECPKPNITTTTTCNYTDAQLKLALDNMESQSVLVRIMVDVMVQCTRRDMPGRLEQISSAFDVNCDIITSDGTDSVTVQCTSNRNRGVSVVNCAVVNTENQQTVQLNQFCEYPAFTFSAREAGITTGEQQLTIDFIDEQGTMAIKVLSFEF